MPKGRGSRTKRRINPMRPDLNPRKKAILDLKREINELFIKEIIREKGVINILHNWLRVIRGKYETTKGKGLISKDQLKNELVQGFMLLNSDLQDVKASPILSEAELEGLDVTHELGKFQQLKKDKWMNEYIKGDIKDWLLNDEIIEVLQRIRQTDTPVMDSIEDPSLPDDQWIDISIFYNDISGSNVMPLGVAINIGKLKNGRKLMDEVFRELFSRTKGGISRAFKLLLKMGLFIPLKVGSHIIKISTEIVLNTLLGIMRSKPGIGMLMDILHGLLGPAFTISDDPRSVQEGLDVKYKVLLSLTFQKTLFNLSKIVNPGDISSSNINERINEGLTILNNYVAGYLEDFSKDQKVKITNVMYSLDKLIEWYLMRRTIVIYNPSSKTLLLEDVSLNERGVRGRGSDYRGEKTIDVEMGVEPEPEDESAAKRKRKNTKRKYKSSKKKNTKRKYKSSKKKNTKRKNP